MLKRYRLADLTRTVPMPDRGGRLFAQSAWGETVDTDHPFYLALIADGDLVPASRDASEASPPVAPAGRRTRAGLRSEARPAAEGDQPDPETIPSA